MPRRQRFKPSRKPKPVVQNESDATAQQTSNLGSQNDQPQNELQQAEPENGGK